MAYESVLFAVTETKVRDKKVGRVGTVTFESANAKGVSKIVLLGEEAIVTNFRVGEFYRMNLEQERAPE